jgi:YD repeat-containing protein
MTIAQILKHYFKSKGSLFLYDSNGKEIYYETSSGYWYKQEYNDNNKLIYFENSKGYWYKYEYDSNGKVIYIEDSTGYIVDNRPKASCDGKVVEIDGKKYQLKEVD